MIVSLNPSYLCNFRCPFCYLTESQLSDTTKIKLDSLRSTLEEINRYERIKMIDLYGGEIGVLPESYLNSLDLMLRDYTDDINCITNLSVLNPYLMRDDITLSVSWDYKAREKYDLVLKHMATIDREISVLMLASPELIQLDIDPIISILNSLSNVISVEIKPYSKNQANSLDAQDRDFEDYVIKWLEQRQRFRFNFENANRIRRSLSGEYSAFSNDHIYVTPANRLAVLEFDGDGREYFLEIDSMSDYHAWTQKEKGRVINNPVCGSCEYVGRCLTEHYREVKPSDLSCSGYRNLLANGLV